MNQNSTLRDLVKQIAIVFLLSTTMAGCSPKPSEQEQETVGCTSDETPVLVNDEDSYEPTVVLEENTSDKGPLCYAPAPGSKQGGEPTVDDEKYEIRLGATRIINKDSHGDMTVRIGPSGSLPELDTTEVYNSLSVRPEDVRAYARVTPRAPDFIIDPAEPQIVPVTSSGTAVSFLLTPKRLGEASVRAQVEFSSTKDFTDIEDSQWTNTLKVNVIVKSEEREANRKEDINKRKEDIDKTTWEYIKDFWEAFVALFFGALLFVIRKFIKKKTGYGEIPGENSTKETPSTTKEKDLGEEDDEMIESETPSTEIKEAPESDDDDYDD